LREGPALGLGAGEVVTIGSRFHAGVKIGKIPFRKSAECSIAIGCG
jgi:hypothetical protein